MVKLVASIILLAVTIAAMANDSTTFFEKEKRGKTLRLCSYTKGDSTIFETSVEAACGGKIALQSTSYSTASFEPRQGFFYGRSPMPSPPNILDFDFNDNDVFIFYAGWGAAHMAKFTISADKQVALKGYSIGSFHTLSEANGGSIHGNCESKWIDGKLYFNIRAGQQFGGAISGLFVFDGEQIKELQFSDDYMLIKILKIDPWGKQFYEQSRRIYEDKEKELGLEIPKDERFQLLSKFYGKEYEYRLMSKAGMKHSDELTYLRNVGLRSHPLFIAEKEQSYSLLTGRSKNSTRSLTYELSDSALLAVECSLKHVLSTFRNANADEVSIAGYLYNQGVASYLYIFYKEDEQMKLATYAPSESEWALIDYKLNDSIKSNSKLNTKLK